LSNLNTITSSTYDIGYLEGSHVHLFGEENSFAFSSLIGIAKKIKTF